MRTQKDEKKGCWGFENRVVTVELTVSFGGLMESLIWDKKCNGEPKPRARLQKVFWLQFGKDNYSISGEHHLQTESSEGKQVLFNGSSYAKEQVKEN